MRGAPPPLGPDIRRWANQLLHYLRQTTSFLAYKGPDTSPHTDGALVWDDANSYPVVSLAGEWRQIVLADGYAILNQDADITAAAANTAYAIQYDTPTLADGITRHATFPTRIVFEEGGIYMLSFSVQVTSNTSSDVKFAFWPRINGTSIGGSTIYTTLHGSGHSTVVSRTSIFQMSPGDYLEVMWSVDNVSGFLDATAASGSIPASPSTTLSISRLRR